MPENKIVAVVPTCRPEQIAKFRAAWAPLFKKHAVTLVTVVDGDVPEVAVDYAEDPAPYDRTRRAWNAIDANQDLICRRTDAIRNAGFFVAAALGATHVLTLDDDVAPRPNWGPNRNRLDDPIRAHLDVLDKRVPLGWMNTAQGNSPYLRGFPYGIREEAPVMLSHGVWDGVPDFDGEAQLALEKCPHCNGTGLDAVDIYGACEGCRGTCKQSLPHTLPYYVGPVPRGVLFPLCGMNVMVRAEALPHLYFAPMGPGTGVEGLHRFADIFMGCFLKREFDRLGWAFYTGGATVLHTRASDARKNVEQEKLGRAWLEQLGGGRNFADRVSVWDGPPYGMDQMGRYFKSYADKRARFADLITGLLASGTGGATEKVT